MLAGDRVFLLFKVAGVWGLFGGISVAAVTASYGFALTARHFFQTPKKYPKRLAPAFGPRRLGSLRSGIDPGAAATVCFAAPTPAVYDFVVRSLRSHARIDPSTQPSDVAGYARSRSRSRARELTLIVEWLEAGGWLWIFGVAAPHPGPLPLEREPICVLFKCCIRLGIARWRIYRIHHDQSPLPPREREPICGPFKIWVRLGIPSRRNSRIHHDQSPLPPGEG
ncbi:hypothetical protein SAMN05216496_2095 [Pseudomonas sp. Z003-0.4C(8344-21)]|nr:hypothetical protein SAMN05216496_2095 [Pseudomonas sp. Z003-0.4C(8344-21)]